MRQLLVGNFAGFWSMKMSTDSREKIIERNQNFQTKFRRDQNLIPSDIQELNRIDKMIRNLPIDNVLQQIAFDEGADITDGATDDEK